MIPREEVELVIDRLSSKGRGIASFNDAKVEVLSGLPADKLRVELGRKRRGVRPGWVREILSPSPLRVTPRCAHVPDCGGCVLQQMDYAAQLKFKEEKAKQLFQPLLDAQKPHLHPILAAASPWEYRNKMEFSFSQNREGERFLGLMLAGQKQRVFNLRECHLTSAWFAQVVGRVRGWWEESGLEAYHCPSDRGSLRTLTLREGKRTGEKMAFLTVSGNSAYALTRKDLEGFMKAVKGKDKGVLSLFLRIQQAIKGQPTQFYEMHLDGPDHIRETLYLGSERVPHLFKISPTSFFQPNTEQAERLYNRVLELLGSKPQDCVFDLYCGTAALGLAVSKNAKEVIGIELNPHALFDAESNKEMNGIQNVTLLCGDVGEKLAELKGEKKPSLVILDPPRSGLAPQVFEHLKLLSPQKILYVSCNPETQARDLNLLIPEGYRLEHLQFVDQFPHTLHLESIALLSK